MGLSCRISYNSKGEAIVTNEDGTLADLYYQALSFTKDSKKALNIWATANLSEFKDIYGPTSGKSASLEDVVQFYNTTKRINAGITPSEIFEIKEMMRNNGFSDLSSFVSKMKNIFMENDVPNYFPERAVSSGLFHPSDLQNLDLGKVVDLIVRMDGELSFNDFTIELPTKSEFTYKNPKNRNIFGASETVGVDKIYEELKDLVTDYTSKEEFYNRVNELPYSEFVEKFVSDDSFADDVIKQFEGMKKIPTLSEDENGELVPTTSTFSTVKNTIENDKNTTQLDADIEYLNNIPDYLWSDSLDEVKEVIKEIESSLAKKGIDIIGLSELAANKSKVLELLSLTKKMVQKPTDNNIREFSNKLDTLLNKTPKNIVRRLSDKLSGLTIVNVSSTKSDQELFEKSGLIKVGEGLYQKVKNSEPIGDLYEYLYQQLLDGNISIPSQLKLSKNLKNDKQQVLKDLEKFIATRDTGLGYFNERSSIYQVIFEHQKLDILVDQNSDMQNLGSLTYDEKYLKTDFVSDFYKYMLAEKLKNSSIYRNSLSKISITDKDITIDGHLGDVRNIEMFAKLADYFKLKKDSSSKKYIPSQFTYGNISEQDTAINFPNTVQEYVGPANQVGNLVAVSPTNSKFIRIGKEVFTQVKNGSNVAVYARIKTNSNPTYYTKELTTYNYESKVVDQMMKQDILQYTKLSAEDIQTQKEKSGMYGTFVQKVKQKSFEYAKQIATKFQLISNTSTLLKEDNKSLKLALDLEKQGKSKEEIYQKTKWFRIKGNLWRREIGDITLIPFTKSELEQYSEELFSEGSTIFPLTDLFNTSEIGNRIDVNNIDLEITFNEKEKNDVIGKANTSENGEKITIKITGSKEFARKVIKGEEFRRDDIGGGMGSRQGILLSKTVESVVNHEFQHLLQNKGTNRKIGNSPEEILLFFARRSSKYLSDETFTDKQQLADALGKIHNKPDFMGYVMDVYRNSIGEKEATSVELRLKDKSTFPDTFESAFDVDVRDFIANTVDLLGENRFIDMSNGEIISSSDKVFEKNLIEFIRSKGVNVIDDSKVFVEKLKSLGFGDKLLKTPQGEILGFESDGSIYLDPEKLNNVTTLHELVHVYQSVLDIKAKQGDTQAQAIISKRKDLFQETANEWKEFHKNNVAPTSKAKAQIIGEKGAANIKELSDSLSSAKSMESLGESPIVIEEKTGWWKDGGDWKNLPKGFIESLNVNVLTTLELDSPKNLDEVIDKNHKIFEAYPELRNIKITFYEDENNNVLGSYSKARGVRINTYRPTAILSQNNATRAAGVSTESAHFQSISATIAHELSHIIQRSEGFADGGSTTSIYNRFRVLYNESAFNPLLKKVDEAIESGKLSDDELKLHKQLKKDIKYFIENKAWSQDPYFKLGGEVDASTVEMLKYATSLDTSNVLPTLFTQQREHYLNSLGLTSSDILPKLQIIGEKGAENLDITEEVTFRMDNLKVARDMDAANKDAKTIRIATGWEKGADGKWRYEIMDGEVLPISIDTLPLVDNPSFSSKVSQGLKLSSIFVNTELYKAYPKLKDIEVVLYQPEEKWKMFSAFLLNGKIHINTRELSASREILVHELQHFIQGLEGFERGSNERRITNALKASYGLPHEGNSPSNEEKRFRENVRKAFERGIKEDETRQFILKNEDLLNRVSNTFYRTMYGEVEAINTESRIDMTPQQRRETLLQETEDVSREDQVFLYQTMRISPVEGVISKLGLDLSSKVYAQAPGESDMDYNDRILKEVEAYLSSPQIANKLDKLREENPSLWKSLVDFIQQLKNWIKNQIGLEDKSINDILSLSKEEYLDALGISILKSEYKGDKSTSTNFQVVGENGARVLDANEIENEISRLENFSQAKKMFSKGISPKNIKLATGWENLSGEWIYEVEDVNIKDGSPIILGEEYSVSDIVDTAADVFKAYPKLKDLKIKFNRDGRNSFSGNEGIIELDAYGVSKGFDELQGEYKEVLNGGEPITLRKSQLESTLNHEIAHAVQWAEGFYPGGSPKSILARAFDIVGFERTDWGNPEKRQLIVDALISKMKGKDSQVITSTLYYLLKNDTTLLQDSYLNISGEVNARNIQNRISLTKDQRAKLLFSETQDLTIREEDKIFLGLTQGEINSSQLSEYTKSADENDYVLRKIGLETGVEILIKQTEEEEQAVFDSMDNCTL